MKAKITYNNGNITTDIKNKQSFEEFIFSLFKKKIYLSIDLSIVKTGINLAINTDNILFVEEIIEGKEK